jgi:CDP-diglyceride synthetase
MMIGMMFADQYREVLGENGGWWVVCWIAIAAFSDLYAYLTKRRF